jgi:tight adherence protein B
MTDARLTIRAQPAAGPLALLATTVISGILSLGTGSREFLLLPVGVGALIILVRNPRNPRGRLEHQAAAAVSLLTAGLRSGYSVPQALELVAREGPQPTASRFTIATREVELGMSFDEAFARMAERTRVTDYHLVSVLISVQREAGGNLARALDRVGDLLRERQELREQISAVTAQQRLSGLVLSLMPFALMVVLALINPGFPERVLLTFTGQLLLGVVLGLLGLNWFFTRSAGRVDL